MSSNTRFPGELQDAPHNTKYTFHILLSGGSAFAPANSYNICSGLFEPIETPVSNQGLSIEQLPELWALKPDSQRFPFIITDGRNWINFPRMLEVVNPVYPPFWAGTSCPNFALYIFAISADILLTMCFPSFHLQVVYYLCFP